MSFEISFRGPKRSFVVESFTVDETVSPRSIARFSEGGTIKIGSETSPSHSEAQDEPYARLQIPNIAGIEKAVRDLNLSLMAFEGDLDTVGPSWVKRSCGVLLHGAHGTGKTLVLKKICETNWGKVFHVHAHMRVAALRDIFKDARQSRRSIVIIDDIDRVVSKDGSSSYDLEMALGEEMDRLSTIDSSDAKIAPRTVVLAGTSSPSDIPRSLKKPGRFTTDILLPLPDAPARKRILRSFVPVESSETQLDLIDGLGDRTHAYTAQDLVLLMEHVCEIARQRRSITTASVLMTEDPLLQTDIEHALLAVRPTAMHDITLKPPTVRWYEIGGQENVKKALRRAVEIPLRVSSCSFIVKVFCLLSSTVPRPD
jgi:AAA family ATPase